MTDENTMNNTNDKTATDLPPANGHAAGNGTANAEPHQAATTETAQPSSKKKKKEKRHQHEKTTVSAQAAPAAAATDQPAPTESTAPTETAEQSPSETPVESIRLRMKVWTDHRTSKRYLMPSAFMRDVVNGQPVTDVMYAYAMRGDDTQRVTLTAGEWQALPFVYVQEDGPAP